MLEYLKNLNRGEIGFWIVVLVIGLFLIRFLVNRYRLSQQREEAGNHDLVHIEAKYWPHDQRRPKFLGLCRNGTPCGAVAQHGTNPILVLANDEYLDWGHVPKEKQDLITAANEVWTFDAHDFNSRAGASNRILQLDRRILKCNHGTAAAMKRELSEELKRTIIFIGETYGADMGRDVAKAALSVDRKHIVDVIFDAIAIAARQRKLQAEKQQASTSGLEIDFGHLKDSQTRRR